MGLETIIGGAVSLIGGASGADAAEDAANAQVEASREATKAQREMFERQVQLQQPWRDFGGAGVNRLAYELGLSPTGFYQQGATGTGNAMAPVETEAQIRERLRAQFTTQPTQTASAAPLNNYTEGSANPYSGISGGYWQQQAQAAQGGTSSTFNQAGYDAAVQAEMARAQQMQQQRDQATATAGTDPNYGNLLRDFGKSDFEVDPGYSFRQEEGEKALQRAAAAGGGLGSGKFLKDAMRFNQGIATDEYGKAFDRFNVNKTNRFNRLAAVSGIGQTAANQTGAAASNFGSQMGNNIIGAGNAAAAGRVGAANAWNGAISNGVSMYQQNALMNSLNQPSGWGAPITPFSTPGGAGNYNFGGGY